MLIQNTSSAASASRLTSDSAPVAVAAPQAKAAPVELQQVTVHATPPTPAQVQNAVDSLNKAMKQINANVEFSIDSDTKQTVIKVVESKTGDVIRQFPSEEILSVAREIDRVQQGLLLKQKA